MKKIFSFFRNLALSLHKRIQTASSLFSNKEWAVFFLLSIILIIGGLGVLDKANRQFMVTIPAEGGSVTEGIVGSPRFINPILAQSDADRDVVMLVFSGLMRKNTQGEIVPDLAESYDISKDGLSYTFILKDNISFQDGKAVTSEDVAFTIAHIQDPLIKSPKRASWEGVTVETPDTKTIIFHLKQPFSGFIEYATLGIIPAHAWEGVSAEQFSFTNKNTDEAIGSGPYAIKSISTDKSGVIKKITLKRFKKFALGTPYLKKIHLQFFNNEGEALRALKTNAIDQLGSISPENTESLSKNSLANVTLPRVYAMFFNQTRQPLFTDRNFVKAVNTAIDRDELIRTTLAGYGAPLYGPLPTVNYQPARTTGNAVEQARTILVDGGWKAGDDGIFQKGSSSTKTVTEKKGNKTITKKVTTAGPSKRAQFVLATSDTPELVSASNYIIAQLKKAGIEVTLQIYDTGTLNNSVIRPREFDTLLFGQVISHPQDLYAFWHSSQRNDPGLNIANYASTQVDTMLDKALTTFDEDARNKLYSEIASIIGKDHGAIFLYSPSYIYKEDSAIKGIEINTISSSADRFAEVYAWYTATDNIWNIFSKDTH